MSLRSRAGANDARVIRRAPGAAPARPTAVRNGTETPRFQPRYQHSIPPSGVHPTQEAEAPASSKAPGGPASSHGPSGALSRAKPAGSSDKSSEKMAERPAASRGEKKTRNRPSGS